MHKIRTLALLITAFLPLSKSAVVENHYREKGEPYMRTNKKGAFRRPQKEMWFSRMFGLMISLLGVALIVLSVEL
jgi:hypothetical protein